MFFIIFSICSGKDNQYSNRYISNGLLSGFSIYCKTYCHSRLIVQFHKISVGLNRNSSAWILILYPIFFKLSARVIFFKKHDIWQYTEYSQNTNIGLLEGVTVFFQYWKLNNHKVENLFLLRILLYNILSLYLCSIF